MDLPRPNWELSYHSQLIQIYIGSALMVVALIYAIFVSRRDRVIYPFLIFIGAGLNGLTEPILDVLGVSTQPEINQITAYFLYGRKIPLYLAICYLYYFPIVITMLVRKLGSGMSQAQWWRFYIGLSIFTTIFDIPGIAQGLWRYYGPMQPPGVLGFPAWWWFGQSTSMCIAALIIHLLRTTVLTGWRSLALIVITPLTLFAALEGPAIPVILALHNGNNPMIPALIQPLTIALHLMLIWIGGRVVMLASTTAGTAQPKAA